MPIYEYRCHDCGRVNEILVGVSAELSASHLACEACGGEQLERLLSRINIGSSLSSLAPCGADRGSCGLPTSGGCCGGACHGH